MTKRQETKEPTMVLRTLPCPLTDADRVRLSALLVVALGDHDRLELDLSEFKAKHKVRILPVESTISRLTAYLRLGKEPREIECAVTRDYAAGQVLVVRTDTEEVVEARAMSAAERQVEIDDLPKISEEVQQKIAGAKARRPKAPKED